MIVGRMSPVRYAISITVGTLLLGAGCMTGPGTPRRPHSATIIRYQDNDATEVVRITKSEDIVKLEKLFPEYRSLPTSTNDAATWPIEYEVHFNFDGSSLYLLSNGDRWTNDRGEFPVKGDIASFLKDVSRKTQKK